MDEKGRIPYRPVEQLSPNHLSAPTLLEEILLQKMFLHCTIISVHKKAAHTLHP